MAIAEGDGKGRVSLPSGVTLVTLLGFAFALGGAWVRIEGHSGELASLKQDRETTASLRADLAKITAELAAANSRLARIEARFDRAPARPME